MQSVNCTVNKTFADVLLNKNKVKVQFVKEYGETPKGVCKQIPIALANKLKDAKIVKIVQIYDPTRDLEQEDNINALIDRVEKLEKEVAELKKASKPNKKEEPKEPKKE